MTQWNQGFFELLHHVKRISLLVFGGMLLLGAGLMLIGGLMMWSAVRRWPHAEGQLLKFEVHPSQDHRSQVQLDLRYQYTVNGRIYSGDVLSPTTADGQLFRWSAERARREFPVGLGMLVIYDPSDPARSFLRRPSLLWDVLLYPVCVGCLGAWMLYRFAQPRHRIVSSQIPEQPTRRWFDGRR